MRCIVEAASRLDRQRVPLDRFGIQFVQIGTDEEAARALQVLDDELSDRYKIRVGISFRGFSDTLYSPTLQDIVDTTPFDPNSQALFNTDYMLKILIGSLDKELDNGPHTEVMLPDRKRANLAPPAFDTRSPPIPRTSSPYVPVGNLLA